MKYELKCGEASELMHAELADDSIDLTVTSPPYDNLRKYLGYVFPFEEIAKELYRVTKNGGIVVWVVADKTIGGSKTGTSFRQGLYFREVGFALYDVMIWRKPNPMPHVQQNRYTPCFEYMFVLTKGKPHTTHIQREPTKYNGKILKTHTKNPESIRRPNLSVPVKPTKIASNVRDYIVAGTNYGHPAIFPEALASDHILSWSNIGDTVLDPLCGSGTTLKMALLNGRNAIGYDISQAYVDLSRERIEAALAKQRIDIGLPPSV